MTFGAQRSPSDTNGCQSRGMLMSERRAGRCLNVPQLLQVRLARCARLDQPGRWQADGSGHFMMLRRQVAVEHRLVARLDHRCQLRAAPLPWRTRYLRTLGVSDEKSIQDR